MLIPVVALGALFSVPTTVAAAAVTATYTFLVAVVVQRDLHLVRDLPRVVTECGLLVGGVLLILGVALGFTHYLIDAQIPVRAAEWATHTIQSRWIFLRHTRQLAVGESSLAHRKKKCTEPVGWKGVPSLTQIRGQN